MDDTTNKTNWCTAFLDLESDICDLNRQVQIVALLRRGERDDDVECDDGSLSMLAIEQMESMSAALRKKFYDLYNEIKAPDAKAA